MQHDDQVTVHACPAAYRYDLFAVCTCFQLRLVRAPRLLGSGVQHRVPLLIRAPGLPFGDGSIRLPWHHLVDADLRGHINGLFIMPGLCQRLNQCKTCQRFRLTANGDHFGKTRFRIRHHGVDTQSPTIGELEAVSRLKPHGLHGMAFDMGGEGQFPPGMQLVTVHRYVIDLRVEEKKGIGHGF